MPTPLDRLPTIRIPSRLLEKLLAESSADARGATALTPPCERPAEGIEIDESSKREIDLALEKVLGGV